MAGYNLADAKSVSQEKCSLHNLVGMCEDDDDDDDAPFAKFIAPLC